MTHRTGLPEQAPYAARPSLSTVALYFLRLGATGFGGPVALANYMRRDWVEDRAWLSDPEFEEGLAIATACPGPLAYQLGIYCGFISQGVAGAVAAAVAFGLAPFLLVLAAAALYERFTDAVAIRALFYGVSPVVVGLILRSAWSLGAKTVKADAVAVLIAIIACAITVVVQKEPTLLLLGAGLFGAFFFAHPTRPATPSAPTAPKRSATVNAIAPFPVAIILAASSGSAFAIFLFFFKTGLLVFGSGLVIVPFLQTALVDDYHWLNQGQFIDAVSIGMISPGPVVISATFVGYLLDRIPGAIAATIGIFLPSLLFTVAGTPLLRHYRSNPHLQGFVRGITAAVVGVLLGTVYLVGRSAIGDWVTIALAALTIATPFVFRKLPDQVLVLFGAAVGIIVYPLLHPALLR
jgi:chromate transporter